MASAGASRTVTVEDQSSYMKIETLGGKNPTEIRSALREVCGEQTVDCSTVSRWARREGRVTINDDPSPGRPKTSIDERSVELVANFLPQDRRVTCGEISQATTGFTNISIPYFDKRFAEKKNLCPMGP